MYERAPWKAPLLDLTLDRTQAAAFADGTRYSVVDAGLRYVGARVVARHAEVGELVTLTFSYERVEHC